jgi:hypothetical protein
MPETTAAALLTDGQVTALVSAIGATAVAIAAAIRWGVGRLVQALDIVAADSKQMRESMVAVKGEVREARDDVREVRDDIAEIRAAVTGATRPRRRVNTPAQGSPIHGSRRPPTGADD